MTKQVGPTAGITITQGIKTYNCHGFRRRGYSYLSEGTIPIYYGIKGFAKKTQGNKGTPTYYLGCCIQSYRVIVHICSRVINLQTNRSFAITGSYGAACIIPAYGNVHSFGYSSERNHGTAVMNNWWDLKA